MTFVWNAEFWCGHCQKNVIAPIGFLNWIEEPTAEEKAGPLGTLMRRHAVLFHTQCGSCGQFKQIDKFTNSLPVWDGTEMKEICDECSQQNSN